MYIPCTQTTLYIVVLACLRATFTPRRLPLSHYTTNHSTSAHLLTPSSSSSSSSTSSSPCMQNNMKPTDKEILNTPSLTSSLPATPGTPSYYAFPPTSPLSLTLPVRGKGDGQGRKDKQPTSIESELVPKPLEGVVVMVTQLNRLVQPRPDRRALPTSPLQHT